MKTTPGIRLFALGAAGGLLVAVGTAFVLHRAPPPAIGTYEEMLRLITAEHLFHAGLLRQEKHQEVLRLIESTLPSSVLYYDMLKFRSEGDILQLWRIREYGEKHGLAFPAEVVSVLSRLPPKPETACPVADPPDAPGPK